MKPLLGLVATTIALAQATSTHYIRRTQQEGGGEDEDNTAWNGIVGGSDAEPGEFPWFAAFVPMVQCGGTLISENRVLTAAHCIVNRAPTSVRIGPTTRDDGEEIAVACGQYHPDYYVGSGGDLYNDVAILKLSGSSTVKPIGLNSNENFPSVEGTPLRVVGYGAVAQGGATSSVLKKMDTAFFSIDTCRQNYPDVEFGTHVCGNVDDEGDCQGDSGGPLFHNTSGTITQVGIVSYGIGCAQPSEDVYAGVAKYHDWIKAQMENDDCNVDTGTPCLWNLLFGCLKVVGVFLRALF